MVQSLKNNLLEILKRFAKEDTKKVVLDNLCMGMCYIILHTHQVWADLISDLC